MKFLDSVRYVICAIVASALVRSLVVALTAILMMRKYKPTIYVSEDGEISVDANDLLHSQRGRDVVRKMAEFCRRLQVSNDFRYYPLSIPEYWGGFRQWAYKFGFNKGVVDGLKELDNYDMRSSDPGMMARGTVDAAHHGYQSGFSAARLTGKYGKNEE